MSNRLSGKVCIITGTGGGMGREAALTFAQEGALVVGCGLFVEEAEATVAAIRAASGTMVSMQPCDLTKPADCQALVDSAVRTFGRIDVLFNNAATAYFNWLEDISDAEWDRNRRSEVDLVFYLTRARHAEGLSTRPRLPFLPQDRETWDAMRCADAMQSSSIPRCGGSSISPSGLLFRRARISSTSSITPISAARSTSSARRSSANPRRCWPARWAAAGRAAASAPSTRSAAPAPSSSPSSSNSE